MNRISSNSIDHSEKVFLVSSITNFNFYEMTIIAICKWVTGERYQCSSISNKTNHVLNGNIAGFLKFAHLNIQGGLKHKKDEVLRILDKYKPSVFGISETNQKREDKIDYNDTEYNFIPGFTYTDNATRVGVLIRKGIKYKLRDDIMKNLKLPCVWLEISLNGARPITVINCYREFKLWRSEDAENSATGSQQLDRLKNFIHYWERSLWETDETWLLGDMNLDSRHENSTDPGHYYQKKMLLHIRERVIGKGVSQLIKNPTRFNAQGESGSVIDHIYTNSGNYTSVQNVKCTGSDHNMVMVVRKCDARSHRTQLRRSRKMADFSKDDFLFVLNNLDLDPILYERSPDIQVAMLTAALNVAADLTCPEVTFQVKKYHTRWWTPQLKELVDERDEWFSRFMKEKKTGNVRGAEEAHKEYRRLRNKINHVLPKAKKQHFRDATENIRDSKQVWSKLDELAGRNTAFAEPITIKHDGILIDNPKTIAELFNKFFQEKTKKIVNNLPPSNRRPRQAVRVQEKEFRTVTTREIRRHILSLNNSKAEGIDTISNVLVKAGSTIIAPYLRGIVNNCIRLSYFPETWKIGKINVTHKKNSKQEMNNYRPVTILSSLSKVIEKVLFKQILEHFQDHGLLDERQYGFRPGRSCTQAVLDYINTVLHEKQGEENKVNSLLIDLSAAFDIVDHKTLLEKLKRYGLGLRARTLMKSYLERRKVFTEIEIGRSTLTNVDYGVPQGSILGPLLYIIYVTDIKDLDEYSKICYADDTTVLVKARDMQRLEERTNEAMRNIISYFAGEGLKLNSDKTELLNHNGRDVEVETDDRGNKQKSSKHARLLGIIIDSNLNFQNHIELLVKDVEYRLWLFKKISKTAGLRARLLYAYGILFSKFVYGINCYAGAGVVYMEKVRVAYDRCVRMTYGRNPEGKSTEQMRDELEILSLGNLVKMQDVLVFGKIIHTGRPENLKRYINTNRGRDTRSNSTRSVQITTIPRTEKLRSSFLFRASRTWNSLPETLRDFSKSQYKEKLKLYFLGRFDVDAERFDAAGRSGPTAAGSPPSSPINY